MAIVDIADINNIADIKNIILVIKGIVPGLIKLNINYYFKKYENFRNR